MVPYINGNVCFNWYTNLNGQFMHKYLPQEIYTASDFKMYIRYFLPTDLIIQICTNFTLWQKWDHNIFLTEHIIVNYSSCQLKEGAWNLLWSFTKQDQEGFVVIIKSPEAHKTGLNISSKMRKGFPEALS